MNFQRLFAAGLIGLALPFGLIATPSPVAAQSDVVRIMNGAASSVLGVAMNRAVIVESAVPFAELSIANPGIADISTLSDRSIYLLGRTPGRTTLTILAADGSLIANVEVQVTPDVAEFRERLRQIMPNELIEVRTANDGIVLSGTVSSITRLNAALELAQRYAPDRVSNLMTVGGTHQVMLRVRFAEVQRSITRSLNSSIVGAGSWTNFGIAAGSGVFADGAAASAALAGESFLTPNAAAGRFGMGFTVGSLQFQVMLEALESNGMLRTLAEPNLVALSGQEARFLAGGEYPIPVLDGSGGIGIEYKPFGVELNFTPRVLDGGVISLSINAAVSGIDGTIALQRDGFTINAFRRRETATTVEMRDGESFAIAGLLQDDFRNLMGQVPWLGDIPILGALFRSADYTRAQSELVIIVTPHLVTPTRGEALVLPTDRIRPPSEREFFLLGRNAAGQTGAAAEIARQDFSGSYGYVMD